ncbi:putative O-methyltransferase YrrM [Pseudomonas sp. JUb42]|jgi:predicted O-methyltransferase YrrM|uniref:O-methyltransferase n=1 Tax=Pseudomonas sp. JUb42 TaxID=2940611 RepID=UPI0021687547|nr:class I SAM-dependent methyltransferase [Pseudomonas sp. JUb42]MCS3469127.1 putative O-methyltransferase YrrM [Pseudomonas sp. JUb42]
MNTLTSITALLNRLFTESEATSPVNSAAFRDLPEGELNRLMHSKTEYQQLYSHLKDFALPVSRETGALLYMLARSSKARSIVEFGTSFGISTLHLAAALRDNGGGHLIGSEFEADKAQRARQNLAAGGLQDLVEIREGDALQTLAVDLPDGIDLVLLDGAKSLYMEVLALVQKHLCPGALIIADNADYSPEYLALVRAPGSGFLSIPFAEDVELSMWLG